MEHGSGLSGSHAADKQHRVGPLVLHKCYRRFKQFMVCPFRVRKERTAILDLGKIYIAFAPDGGQGLESTVKAEIPISQKITRAIRSMEAPKRLRELVPVLRYDKPSIHLREGFIGIVFVVQLEFSIIPQPC